MSLIGAMGGAAGGMGGSSSGSALLESLTPMAAQAYNYTGTPAPRTGIQQLINWASGQHLLTPGTVSALVPELAGAFGGYPDNKSTEVGPDGLFIALFAIMGLAHLGVWIMNLTRRQYFHLQLGIAFFCLMKVIGFACRLGWAGDVTRLKTGICSLVFIQVAQLVLESLNMVLAHRIFTWRHPETGTHWVIVQFINFVYFIVLIVIAMAIVGQGLPYIYFLGEKNYTMCKNVMKAAAVLNLFYATLPIQFLVVAYLVKPGTIVKNPRMKVLNKVMQRDTVPPVYQASWIRSAGLFYYPEKNSQIRIYKGEPDSDAVRIIPSREPPGHGHRRLGIRHVHPDAPHLHWATLTVTITSLTLVMNTCFRLAACFKVGSGYGVLVGETIKVSFWPNHPYVMYIFYGATEFLILLIYLLMRIDLRFYIPDMARKPPKDGIPERIFAGEENPIWTDAQDVEKESHSHHDSDSQLARLD